MSMSYWMIITGSTRKMWAFLPLKCGCSAWIHPQIFHSAWHRGTARSCSRRRCCRSGITRHCSQEMRMITRSMRTPPFAEEAASHGGDGCPAAGIRGGVRVNTGRLRIYPGGCPVEERKLYGVLSFLPVYGAGRTGLWRSWIFRQIFWCRDRGMKEQERQEFLERI